MTDQGPPGGPGPALDGRVRRQVERMADGRRITYYSWRAGEDDALAPGGHEAGARVGEADPEAGSRATANDGPSPDRAGRP